MTDIREPIAAALLTVAQSVQWNPPLKGGRFQVVSRKFFAFEAASAYPALIQIEPMETIKQQTRLPPIRTLMFRWLCYFTTDQSDPTDVGARLINTALDAIEAAIHPPWLEEEQTLDGLVHKVWIEGEVHKVSGDDDGKGIFVVPISVLVP